MGKQKNNFKKSLYKRLLFKAVCIVFFIVLSINIPSCDFDLDNNNSTTTTDLDKVMAADEFISEFAEATTDEIETEPLETEPAATVPPTVQAATAAATTEAVTTQLTTVPQTTQPPATTEAGLNGVHTQIYDNGDKYEGNFVNGVRQGQGRYEWANGIVFIGEFENGNPVANNGEYIHPTEAPTDPPQTRAVQERTVYWVENGEVYHSKSSCRTLARSINIYSGTIAQSGKSRGCRVC